MNDHFESISALVIFGNFNINKHSHILYFFLCTTIVTVKWTLDDLCRDGYECGDDVFTHIHVFFVSIFIVSCLHLNMLLSNLNLTRFYLTQKYYAKLNSKVAYSRAHYRMTSLCQIGLCHTKVTIIIFQTLLFSSYRNKCTTVCNVK